MPSIPTTKLRNPSISGMDTRTRLIPVTRIRSALLLEKNTVTMNTGIPQWKGVKGMIVFGMRE
jgi:hypothetical protein